MKTEQRQVKLCSIGLGGNSMEYGRHCHGSWYLHTPEDIEQHYAAELTEGVLLVDKRAVLTEHPEYAFRAPLVNVDLQDNQRDEFQIDQRDGLMVSALAQNREFAVSLACAAAHKQSGSKDPGPLDSVSINEYVAWWFSRGATIYRYNGAQFVQV